MFDFFLYYTYLEAITLYWGTYADDGDNNNNGGIYNHHSGPIS